MKKNNDLVFACLKCGHLRFIQGTPEEKIKKISTLNKKDCPECGEEGYENWVYVRTGNYEKEFGENND